MWNKLKKPLQHFCLLGALALTGLQSNANPPALKNGRWRSEIKRPDGQAIVFNFEVKDSLSRKIIYLLNGTDRLLVDSLVFKGDSVFIELPFYDSRFRAQLQPSGDLEGVWIKKAGDREQVLPFSATPAVTHRYAVTTRPSYSINGRWAVTFLGRSEKPSIAVGEFRQKGSQVTGTFLTPTGDYRFLEGVLDGDSLKLSTFDGSFAFYFTAKVENNNTISNGLFYAGANGKQQWSAVRNPDAHLPDGYTDASTYANNPALTFNFNTTDGQTITQNDPRFRNKVVVIQILGSWCPNCIDETKFLSEYYQQNKRRGVELLGVAYERKADVESSTKALQPVLRRFQVNYPVALAGVAVSDTLRAEKSLPQIGKINAFPTTIFLDKEGNIRKIHSGFDGPATGDHYTAFKKEFEEIVNNLLKE